MKELKNISAALCMFSMLFSSCSPEKKEEGQSLSCPDFSIRNFTVAANFEKDSSGNRTIYLDYDHANTGFVVPSEKQSKDGIFIDYEVKNNTSKALCFLIYYQDESYKFPEYDSVSGRENPLAEENFYGQRKVIITNIPNDGQYHQMHDALRITGNPRDEKRYISNGVNNHWQRNPRVGNYSFMLVVATEEDLKKVPGYITDISEKNKEHYSNPYGYYLFGEGKNLKSTLPVVVQNGIKVIAKPDLGAGIYVDDARFTGSVDKSHFCETCGQDSNLYYNAPIQQFINYVDLSTKMDNIPVIADILKDNYSKLDYNWNRAFYTKDELIPTILQTSRIPCSTVFSDPKEKKITIKNPKTAYGEWKKESVGIITRHGLTYGKYRVKVKLTELLNRNGVWNGLTNAIWLITQGGGEWNFRRKATKDGGYMATYWGGPNDKRVPEVDYTEIDFEILKTVPYCPNNVFPPVFKNPGDDRNNINSWNIPLPEEVAADDGNITVACTNWDMASHDPVNFGVGCNPVPYMDQTFEAHRWDHNYRALTEKKQESDDELFGSKYYYFEIDWRPTEIIWRIGPEPDKMRVVGYMNDKVTAIPNNQMLLIITQEYHNTKWWPGAPYSQDNLPFPLNDIPGEIYELTVE